MKLSKAQQKVVDLMKANPEAKLLYMAYMGSYRPNPYWFINTTMAHFRCSTIDKLLDLGVLKLVKSSTWDKGYAVLKDA